MSAKRKTHSPESIPEIVERLAARSLKGFTREQFTRALEKLRSLWPSCEVRMLHADPSPNYEEITIFFVEAAFEEAERVLGKESLPQPPKLVNWPGSFGLQEVRRVRGSRVLVRADLIDGQDGPLGAFTPTAIRGLAPERMSLAQWREHLRNRVATTLDFHGPSYISHVLEFPLEPKRYRPKPNGSRQEFCAALIAELEEANSDFRLASADLQRLIAIYSEAHAEVTRKILSALDVASVERLGRESLRLVVDNTHKGIAP